MAFYVRLHPEKIIWHVHKIPADAPDGIISREEALAYPLGEKTYQGYFGDEHDDLLPPDKLSGPFETEEEAREALWVEDV